VTAPDIRGSHHERNRNGSVNTNAQNEPDEAVGDGGVPRTHDRRSITYANSFDAR